MAFGIDVRDVVPAIRVPTMVIHHADDQVCHIENSRFAARHIPGTASVEPSGPDHFACGLRGFADRTEMAAGG
jgi:pimeloyl-ACP methyl ester carboxylesterase